MHKYRQTWFRPADRFTGVRPLHTLTRAAFRLCCVAVFACRSMFGAQGACKGPADLEQAVASRPTAAAYDALGAYFGRHNQVSCALSAFQSALRLEPKSWEAHYDLGLLLLGSGDPQRAAKEFRTAQGLRPQNAQTHAGLG